MKAATIARLATLKKAAAIARLARAFASDGGAAAVKAGRRRMAFTPIWRRWYMTVAAASVESTLM